MPDATLYLGPPNDMETIQIHRDTYWGESFDQVVIYAVETMPKNRRYGAYIQSGNRKLDWPAIEAHYRELKPGQKI